VVLRLDNDRPPSDEVARRFEEKKVLARLEALDAKARRYGVAALDASRNELIGIGMETAPGGQVTRNCYGVFHLSWLAEKHPEWPRLILDELDDLKDAIRATHGVSLKFVIWAGMGGSAEDKAMYLACGLLKRGPKLYVLDSTDPAKLKAIVADMKHRAGSLRAALASTLVVGMALGMTSYEPVVNLEKLAALYDGLGLDSRPNFIYLTLTGSLLDQFAARRNYRRVALQLDDGHATAGRHSAPLTRGSLYPLGLAGVPLRAWISGTFLRADEIAAAFRLAAFLHQQGLAGRDKVTLALSRSLAGAALWTKQNFEESLGKSEQLGLKLVINEPLRMADYRAPKDARQDRAFLLVGRQGEPAADRRKLALLRRSGYPLAVLTLPAEAPLSRYLQFIHYTVFALGWLRAMNFVTQPGVELYKSIAQPLYENSVFQGGIENTKEWKQLKTSPRQARWRGGVSLHYDRLPCGFEMQARDAASAYAALLGQLAAAGMVEYGELTFFGDTRYHAPGRKLRQVLERAAVLVFRESLKMPADVYEGPAMNHSYHEMVIGHGRCLSTVLLSEKAESMPEAGYKADYHRAQFLATQMALEQRGRLVISITLRDLSEASLKALDEFFRQAAAQLKRWK
jgi:glucose-6-phosphate isomerase